MRLRGNRHERGG